LPSHTVVACGVGLSTVKLVVSYVKYNRNKYTPINNVTAVIKCLLVVNNMMGCTIFLAL